MTDPAPTIPDDDPTRELVVTDADRPDLPHVGMVGDTYTILVSGEQTAGAYTLIDMLIPPGGGPGPHRHDFEELFVLLDGEIDFTFRGAVRTATAGEVVNIPANAPHFFHNSTSSTVHLLCMCTPAAQDGFFLAVGQPLPDRSSTAPHLEGAAFTAWLAKAAELAPRFRTELLPPS